MSSVLSTAASLGALPDDVQLLSLAVHLWEEEADRAEHRIGVDKVDAAAWAWDAKPSGCKGAVLGKDLACRKVKEIDRWPSRTERSRLTVLPPATADVARVTIHISVWQCGLRGGHKVLAGKEHRYRLARSHQLKGAM